MTMNRQHHRSGFSLVETLVAVALIFAAMAGPVTLIAHLLFSSSFSRNDLVAHTLAQEAIELVRAVRDNNEMCQSFGNPILWYSNPVNGAALNGYYEMDAAGSFNIICGSAIIDTPSPITRTSSTCDRILNLSSSGVYTYGAGTPTGFTRCVQICVPPRVGGCSDTGPDGDIPATDQMEIVSTVSWSERGFQKTITLNDRLYNWE